MKKSVLYLVLLFLVACSSEDACFSSKGNEVSEIHPVSGFHTIEIPMNVSVEIIPDNQSIVEINSFENRIGSLQFYVKDSVLTIINDLSCSILKSYETAVLKIHTPVLRKIHSKTQFKVYSKDTLHFPDLFLYSSIPNEKSASTHFDLKINNKKLSIEDNQVGYFELKGKTDFLKIGFYGANSILDAKALKAQEIEVYHRSNQNMHLFPIKKIKGTIASVGHIYLYNKPDTLDVNQLYSGALIFK